MAETNKKLTAATLDRVDRAAFFARFGEGEAVPYLILRDTLLNRLWIAFTCR